MSDQPGSAVQVATSVQPGQDLSFRVSGTGGFPSEEPAQEGATSSSPSAATNRPGGGLGPPIDAPDALANYRWLILGVLAVVLSGGAYISVTRSPKFGRRQPAFAAATVASDAADTAAPERPAFQSQPVNYWRVADPAAPPAGGSALLEALKNELFELEVERQQGVISQSDYAKQKAAFDQTLQVALQRSRKT
jgi:hypothetical protein